MKARSLVVATSIVMASVTAHAQPGMPIAPPPETIVPPPADPMDQMPGRDPEQLDAAYDVAFQQLVDGHPELAAAGFDAFALASGDPQRVASARELARIAHTLAAKHARYVLGTPADLEQGIADDDTDEGRTAFISFTTMYGLYAGVVLIDDLDIDDVRTGVTLVAATTAVGLVASYFGTKHKHITGAEGGAYGLGMIFGMANAGLLLHPLGSGSSEGALTTLLVAGAVGGVVGLGFAAKVKPTRGQMTFAGNMGILGIETTGLALGITQPDMNVDAYLVTLAAGLDVGIGVGIGVGRDLTWSVSRGSVVSLGTFVGSLTGAAAGLLILGADFDDDGARLLSATTLAGMWGGFGLTTHWTRHMRPDRRYAPSTDAPPPQLTVLPVRGGAGIGLAGQF